MSTETVDPRYVDIDRWPTETAVAAMLEGQIAAVAALTGQEGAIAAAADAAAIRLGRGGRLVYAGAGTSGRIAVQDGVELGPTFGWGEDRLVYLMAGGPGAFLHAVEGAEDDGDAARAEIAAAGVGPDDVVIGVAASGRTPYTIAAVEAGRAAGALSVAVANNPGTPLLAAAEHALLADTGSEAVAGSTRMKAGTAQKAVLNLFSTATMLRMGRVHGGLMVDMRISNAKLVRRGAAMVRDLAGVDDAAALAALEAAGRDIKAAVLVARGMDVAAARALLAASGGSLRAAIAG
ncbi:N-acetylmuramic acid 6-phosphate etherase [Sphingomonas hengshuiensis]|uniref:N-acetylmuramic acid-6-phosphate etherase n=1 Tax=Sphingomonas hengshuiensis TaxID=1609977 RepID=A0A7U4J8Y3_9SPHN|nr:N-acetylmuramic acid 6-phosphate etherase [Sphingomonas hengshuiensis]AJP72435.1 N-acetylmuramic acid-6-phosphate etherase [Sphingomonas hengshuiensis]